MFHTKCFSRLGMSVALSLPVVVAEAKTEKQKDESKPFTRKLKPSQLPVYEDPQDIFSYEYHGKKKGKLEEGISVVRQEFGSAYDATADTREGIKHILETGKAHSLTTANYVWDEDNIAAKVGGITIGALLGLLIGGRRKGFVKKIMYTSVGAAGAAGLVYPREAIKIGREVFDNAEDFSLIAYNFITGVKPQSDIKSTPAADPPKKPTPVVPAAPPKVSTASQSNDLRFESLLQQSSDITLWGFRLFDREDVSRKPIETARRDPHANGTPENGVPGKMEQSEHPSFPTEEGFQAWKREDPPDISTNTGQSTDEEPSFLKGHETVVALKGLKQSDFQGSHPSTKSMSEEAVDDNRDVDLALKKKESDHSSSDVPQTNFYEHPEGGSPSPGTGIGSKLVVLVKDVAEEVLSSAVADVAEEVKKDASFLSKEAKMVVDISDEANLVLKATEKAAEATMKGTSSGETVETVSQEFQLVTSIGKAAASGVEALADIASEAAESVEEAASVFKELKKEDLKEDAAEIVKETVTDLLQHSSSADNKEPSLSCQGKMNKLKENFPDVSINTGHSTEEASLSEVQETMLTLETPKQSDFQSDHPPTKFVPEEAIDESKNVNSPLEKEKPDQSSSSGALQTDVAEGSERSRPSPATGIGSNLVVLVKDVAEEVLSSAVADVAKEVKKDASFLSKEAKMVVDVSDEANSVLKATEKAAEATTKGTSSAETVETVSQEFQLVTSLGKAAASGVEALADIVSDAAESVEKAASEFGKQKNEDLKEDVVEIADETVTDLFEHSSPADKKGPFLSFIHKFLHFLNPQNEHSTVPESTVAHPETRGPVIHDENLGKPKLETPKSHTELGVSESHSESETNDFSSPPPTKIPDPQSSKPAGPKLEAQSSLSVSGNADGESVTTDVLGDIAEKVIDSMLNLKTVAVEDKDDVSTTQLDKEKQERLKSESVDFASKSIDPSHSISSAEPEAHSKNQPSSEESTQVYFSEQTDTTNTMENLADALIDSMLNIQIAPAEETSDDDGEESAISSTKNEEDISIKPVTVLPLKPEAQLESKSELISSSSPAVDNDASISETPKEEGSRAKGFLSSLKRKLNKKTEVNENENNEDEEKDINEMDSQITPEVDASDSAKDILTPIVEDGFMVVEASGHDSFMPDDFENLRSDAPVVPAKAPSKDVVVSITPKPPTAPVEGDLGQSNPEDKDMYTTRS